MKYACYKWRKENSCTELLKYIYYNKMITSSLFDVTSHQEIQVGNFVDLDLEN